MDANLELDAPAETTDNNSIHKSRSTGRNERGASTRAKIVAEARKQIAEKGLKNTAPATITTALGIPRPLFYHYFTNMDELSDEVLAMELNKYGEQVRESANTVDPTDIDGAVDGAIALWRKIHNADFLFSDSTSRDGNGELYMRFMDIISNRIATYLVEHVVPNFERNNKTEYQRTFIVPPEHLQEFLYFIVQGLNTLMRSKPDLSDDVLRRIMVQTLRLENFVKLD